MPRPARGSVYFSDGSWYARVVVAPKKYAARALPWIAFADDLTAKAWAATLQRLVDALRELARSADIPDALATAIRVGREDPEHGLTRVQKSVAKLVAERAADRLASPLASSGPLTFKRFGQKWTSGKLHAEYPDHVRARKAKTGAEDAGRLEKYVYPIIGGLPLSDVTLKHAQDVLRQIPRDKSSATRRQVAQCIARILNLAVYPCELIPRSPLPKGFLPAVKTRPGAYLYPAEDRALLGCVGSPEKPGVPLANRLLYGFLAREGMRRDEALALTWDDLDLERGAVRLDTNKTDDPRAWALDPSTVAALQWWRDTHCKDVPGDACVFAAIEAPGRLADALRDHLKVAGVKRAELFEHSDKRRRVNVHALRATFVTLSLANGRTETWVQDRTGHRSSAMVNRYRRVARTAAELRLGALDPLDRAIPEIAAATGAGKVREPRPNDAGDEPQVPDISAERAGFEPAVRLPVHMISNGAVQAPGEPYGSNSPKIDGDDEAGDASTVRAPAPVPQLGSGAGEIARLAAKARIVEALSRGDVRVLATELREALEALAGVDVRIGGRRDG